MSKKSKSGKQVIEEFFKEIASLKHVDKKTVDVLTALYEKNKFTSRNIYNALEEARKTEENKDE